MFSGRPNNKTQIFIKHKNIFLGQENIIDIIIVFLIIKKIIIIILD